MNRHAFATLGTGLILTFLTAVDGPAADTADRTPAPGVSREIIFQTAPIDALLAGVYDGSFSFGDLRKHGDFGLGTFDALDGEMILLDDIVYQVPSDGKVRRVDDAASTPFSCVTYFDRDSKVVLAGAGSLTELQRQLDATIGSPNLFYAFRADGEFSHVKTRSVPRQQKPYPTLADAAKQQAVFEFAKIRGTLLGFRCPPYTKGLNVPGYHFHFITEDRQAGGHVLDLRCEGLDVFVDPTPGFAMELPEKSDFLKTDLTHDREAELHRVER